MNVIELDGVTKSYGRHRGIVEVDLAVEQGEIFGYLGPNGAGKTTTIRLMLDLIRPNRGSVTVLGGTPSNLEIRRRIGYLAGELDLYESLTGAELVRYLDHLRGGRGARHARELADRLHLDLSRPIEDLSKGNKQKLGVVQALMHRPELLILDEPTSGLDPLIQQELYALIEEARSEGATVFLSSHVLSEVERIAERVGIIREGRVVEVAGLEDLKAKAVRRFQVTFDEDVPRQAFEAIDALSDVRLDGRVLMCRVVGSADPFVKAIARYRVASVISQGADLEELFLAYYRGEIDAA